MLGVGQRRLGEVNIHLLSRNAKVEVIGASRSQTFEHFPKGQTRLFHDKQTQRLYHLGSHRETRSPKVVFQKAEIALIDPIDLGRRLKTIEEMKRLGIFLARRTPPSSINIALVAMRHLFCQLNQVVFHFTLNPSTTVFANDKEVWRVQNTHWLSFFARVHQLDRPRLVVKLQDGWVMLKLINGRKFPSMALKLNSTSHFLTGIATTHIASTTLDQPRR